MASARSSSAASVSTSGSSALTSTYTRSAGTAERVERRGNDFLGGGWCNRCVGRASLQAAHVQQVAHDTVETIRRLIDSAQQADAVVGAEADVALQQPGHRRLDRGQRCAQVVRDGLQQRRAQQVCLRQRLDGGRLAAEAFGFHRERQLVAERTQHREIVVVDLAAAQDQLRVAVVVERDGGAVVRGGRRVLPGGRGDDPRVVGSLQHRHSVQAEERAQLIDQVGHRVCRGDDRAGRAGERSGVGTGAQRLARPTGGTVDQHAHADGDGDEHDERDEVVAVADGERVRRLGEVVVREQRCRRSKRPRPAAGHRSQRSPSPTPVAAAGWY